MDRVHCHFHWTASRTSLMYQKDADTDLSDIKWRIVLSREGAGECWQLLFCVRTDHGSRRDTVTEVFRCFFFWGGGWGPQGKYTSKAGESMTRVPKMTHGKISLASRFDFCLNFLSFILPNQLLYSTRNIYIYIYTHTHTHTHIWLRRYCTWITVATKQYCEWNILTEIQNFAKYWLYICHWGAGLALSGRIRDIGQNVLQSPLQTEVVAAPVISAFSSLSHSPRRPLLQIKCNNFTIR
jgi:hypothetical protein